MILQDVFWNAFKKAGEGMTSARITVKGEVFDEIRNWDIQAVNGSMNSCTLGRPRLFLDAGLNDLGKVERMEATDHSCTLVREDTIEDRVYRLELNATKADLP